MLSPLAASANPYNGGNPIQVLNQDLLPPAGTAAITIAAPVDFGVLANPATTRWPCRPQSRSMVQPLPSQTVNFTWAGGTATADTGPDGVATIQVPVVAPAGPRTVTATVDPSGESPLVDLEPAPARVPAARNSGGSAHGARRDSGQRCDGRQSVDQRRGDVLRAGGASIGHHGISPSSRRCVDLVPATVTLSPNRLSATLIPDAPLGLATIYTVDVSTAVTDLVGNALAAASTTTFTTWTVPGAPTDVGAAPGDQSATVTWTAPLDDGGTPIVGFDVSVYDEFGVLIDGLGGTAGPTDTSFEVTGLDNGTAYQFAVAAVNSAGSGPLSGSRRTGDAGLGAGCADGRDGNSRRRPDGRLQQWRRDRVVDRS